MNDVPDLPEGYGAFVEQLKRLVRTARLRATRVVNTELLLFYWDIGRAILDWVAIDRCAHAYTRTCRPSGRWIS